MTLIKQKGNHQSREGTGEKGGGMGMGVLDPMDEQEEPKVALKGLNERLRGFLEHMNQLEETNLNLEEQIREWWQKHLPPPRDWSEEEAQAQELRAQISILLMENAEVSFQSDAVKLKAEQLKTRCESAEKLRLQKEDELLQLKIKKGEVEADQRFLEKQLVESQTELKEIMEDYERLLDQQHQRTLEDRARMRAEFEDGKGMDLSWISHQYHFSSPGPSSPDSASSLNPAPGFGLASWTVPNSPMDVFPPQAKSSDKALKKARAELTEARKQWHRIQVEMESLLAVERSLKSSLRHTQLQYSVQLRDLSKSVTKLESELETVRDDLEVQKQNHTQLLNTKMRLEKEIATYRKLLEHEEGRFLTADAQPLKLQPWKGSEDENGYDEGTADPFFTDEVSKKCLAVQRQRGLVILTEPVGNQGEEISTVKTQEFLEGNVVRESAEGHGNLESEKIDKVIKKWEGSFFKGNPKLRKKSVSLRFDLHMAAADEGCPTIKQDSLPNVEVCLVMRRSRSISTFDQ
ncbi:hypothetical protein DNTS_033381 [Danionella cerebrum]|uniref:IF rod domain-containing protein n=1 Tax=Danionella cerebrum TaxID=2873325 RepID=A0A553RFR3_9TELE|nr:hypothetical protein DNTS_033381 [Danionella translucida]TRZ00998.1 hypothetical protein DNTS_033381 [Danionella translucida]